MKLTVEIDEAELQKVILDLVAKKIVSEYSDERRVMEKSVQTAVKEIVYSQKEKLLERCVTRASAELTRKAMPKLIECMVSKNSSKE